ncbi:hypothetical protein [Desulfitobacterium sp. AusDCA]|uniref:hypothetical protein n=1 Tax=Desulfitobacterium sp. AusDCA TaxID=3240383 RepID=UPI003DA7698C
MFISKATLAKITLGSMISSVMTFATLMPVSAHELQTKSDSNAGMSMQGTVQEGLLPLPLSNLELPDKAAAKIISLGDGLKEILVMPRAYRGKLMPMNQNGVAQTAISASQEQAFDGQTAASTGDEQAANSGTTVTAPADKGQAANSGTTATAPADKGQAANSGTNATAPAEKGQAANSGTTATAPAEKGQAANSGTTATAPAEKGQAENKLYDRLLTSYDKLLSIYDRLLSFFGTAITR